MLEYSPTVTGHICNCLSSVSEPYKRSTPTLIKRERAFTVFTYCRAYCPLELKPLTAPSEKVHDSPYCWGVRSASPQHKHYIMWWHRAAAQEQKQLYSHARCRLLIWPPTSGSIFFYWTVCRDFFTFLRWMCPTAINFLV